MGGGISISVEEIDTAPSPNATPSDALKYCRTIIQKMTAPPDDHDDHDPSTEFALDGLSTSRPLPLCSHVPFESLLDKLKHVEASLLWLRASERRSSEQANQEIQRKVQNERLQARLAKRNRNNNRQKEEKNDSMLEEITLETPRSAARTALVEEQQLLTPRITQRIQQTEHYLVLETTKAHQSIEKNMNEVRRVIVDAIIWVTRLLHFGNQSTLTGETQDGLNAFNECEELLKYINEQLSTFEKQQEQASTFLKPWDRYSVFSVQCPLLLLLKSREIKKGIASYFDFQTLMYGINSMHAEFGAMQSMMFGSFDHPDDAFGAMTRSFEPPPPPPAIPVHHRKQLHRFVHRVVNNYIQTLDPYPTNSSGHFVGKKLKVLDVGCGGGSFMSTMTMDVKKHVDYVGVDLSQESIRMAQEDLCGESKTNNENGMIQLICQDIIENSTFEENEFDVIVVNDVINFIPPSETLLLLSKLKTWLCHEGEMFITAPLISAEEEEKDGDQTSGSGGGGSGGSGGSGGGSGGGSSQKRNFMCGIERGHPFIPGLFFRMFYQDELPDMCSAVGLQVRRVEIVEPPVADASINVPKPGPPVMMSGSPTAWGKAGGGSGGGGGGGGGGEEEGGSTEKEARGLPSRGLPSLGSEDVTPYRAIILILETK